MAAQGRSRKETNRRLRRRHRRRTSSCRRRARRRDRRLPLPWSLVINVLPSDCRRRRRRRRHRSPPPPPERSTTIPLRSTPSTDLPSSSSSISDDPLQPPPPTFLHSPSSPLHPHCPPVLNLLLHQHLRRSSRSGTPPSSRRPSPEPFALLLAAASLPFHRRRRLAPPQTLSPPDASRIHLPDHPRCRPTASRYPGRFRARPRLEDRRPASFHRSAARRRPLLAGIRAPPSIAARRHDRHSPSPRNALDDSR